MIAILLFVLFILLISVIVEILILAAMVRFLLSWDAPYVGIPAAVIPQILKSLKLRPDSQFFDLGCGGGRVVFAAAGKGCASIGIERSLFPHLAARFKKRVFRLEGVFIRRDFHEIDLSEATHIFTYLFPNQMKSLEPKFAAELAPGTRLVSCDFPLPAKEPVEIVDLHRPRSFLAHRLYIYIY